MLIGHWKLDGDIKDSSSNQRDGAIYGATPTTGIIDGAYSFNGIDDEIRIQFSEIVVENFSLSYWVKTSETNLNCALNMRNTSYSGTTTMIGHRISGSFSFRDQAGISANCNFPAIASDAWTHILAVREGVSTRLYIDGILYSTNENSSLGVFNIGDISLGFDQYSGGRLYWSGAIDDVRIYDHALSDKDIKWLANSKMSKEQGDEINREKILHYTFNDFQEPTENGVLTPDFSDNISGYTGVETTRLLESESYTGYSLKIEHIGTVNTAARIKFGVDSNFTSGTKAFSVYAKAEGNFIGRSLRTYTGQDWYTLQGGTLTEEYKKFWGVFPVGTNSGGPMTVSTYTTESGVYYVHSPQIEDKPHITPFTEGSRVGTITDKSGNNNDVPLGLSSPRWVFDENVRRGSYDFNGSQFIQTPTINIGNVFTFSCWVYPISDGTIFKDGTGDTDSRIRYINGRFNILYCDSPNGNTGALYTETISPNQWYHIAFILNNDKGKIISYVNGNKDSENNFGHPIRNWSQVKVIGKRGSIDTEWFEGRISDIKVYKRELSEDEIKRFYKTRISIDSNGNYWGIEPNHGSFIGHWPLDGNVKDYIDSNHGVNNGAKIAKGLNSLSYEFDDVHQNISGLGNKSNLKEFTYSAWIYRTVNQDNFLILGSRYGNNTYLSMAVINGKANLHKHHYNNNNDINIATSSTTITTNEWYHIVITYDNGNTKTYVNGLLENTQFHENTEYNPQPIQINYDSSVSINYRYFLGKIQDVRIFNRAITDEEVKILYNINSSASLSVYKNSIYSKKIIRG